MLVCDLILACKQFLNHLWLMDHNFDISCNIDYSYRMLFRFKSIGFPSCETIVQYPIVMNFNTELALVGLKLSVKKFRQISNYEPLRTRNNCCTLFPIEFHGAESFDMHMHKVGKVSEKGSK